MDNFEKRMRALLAAALPGTDVTHLSPREFCVWQRVGRLTPPTVYPRDLVVVVDDDLLGDIQVATETEFQSRLGPKLARSLLRALVGYDPASKNPNPFVVSLADSPQDQVARAASLTVAAVTNPRSATMRPAVAH
ncbi:hypothetical protein [Paraburkholderia phosphatilytica]|uniref:hypothetical protein n=1 Tax=Paraburkholderia phosphatilytica TaxID=2282883 RepID=UPI000E4DD430|nr:hypothetical protein [Paraburkholderia phosphatilytica]